MPEQRQEGLRNGCYPEDIGRVNLLEDFADVLIFVTVSLLNGDTSVVDQDIEAAVLFFDELEGLLYGRIIGHVQLDWREVSFRTGRRQRFDGCFAAGEGAAADKDMVV